MVKSVLRIGLVAVTVVACAFGGVRLVGFVRSSVHGQDRFRITLHDIEFTPPPAWVHGDLLAEVRDLSGLPDTLHALEPALASKIRDAFAVHPWVREVVEVRVRHPASVRVRLVYREPVAVVRTPRALEPVDRDGVLLPPQGLEDPRAYLTISGVRSTPTGPAGTRWEDPGLAAGAATAAALAPHHRALGLVTIDVGYYRGPAAAGSSVYLLTEQGTRVRWGRAPGADAPGEVPTQDKIDRMLKYVTDHGSLDQPSGPYEIDLTHWQEIGIRPRTPTPVGARQQPTPR